jgi:biotin carboxylase
VSIAFPTPWDLRQLERCRARWERDYDVLFESPSDADCPWDLDLLQWIRACVDRRRGAVDGVMSSSDYPGATVAGAVATELGLPTSAPSVLLRCAHKWYARGMQRARVPDATPPYWLVDTRDVARAAAAPRYPCFVKPVKGSYSVLARRIERPEDLVAFLGAPEVREYLDSYLRPYAQLLRAYGPFEVDERHFIAEGVLTGRQVTVEGWIQRGEAHVLGVVDSVMRPGTNSFMRFDYPSALPEPVLRRMGDVARRVVEGSGLDATIFNVEMLHDPSTGTIGVVELNARMCGQFADLYEKVDGVNGYEIALALATGRPPPIRRREGAHRTAASVPFRVFEPVRVLRAPDQERVAAVEDDHPGTIVWNECEPGQVLDDFTSGEDGASARYAVVNLGASDRASLLRTLDEIRERLGHAFAPAR